MDMDYLKFDETVPADGSTWRWLAGKWISVKPVDEKENLQAALDYANSVSIFTRENRNIYDAFLRGYEHAVGSKKKSNDSEPQMKKGYVNTDPVIKIAKNNTLPPVLFSGDTYRIIVSISPSEAQKISEGETLRLQDSGNIIRVTESYHQLDIPGTLYVEFVIQGPPGHKVSKDAHFKVNQVLNRYVTNEAWGFTPSFEPNLTNFPDELPEGLAGAALMIERDEQNQKRREILENPMTPDEAFLPDQIIADGYLTSSEARILKKPEGSPDHIIRIIDGKGKNNLMTIATDLTSEHQYAAPAREFLKALRQELVNKYELAKAKAQKKAKEQDERSRKYGEFRTLDTKAPLTKDDFGFFPGIDSDMWKFEVTEYPYRYSVATADAGVSFFCSIQLHLIHKNRWEDQIFSTYKSLEEALELFNRHR